MLHLNHFDTEPDSLSGILTLDRFRPEFFLQMFRLHAAWEARLGAGSTHESDVNQLQSADGGWTLTVSQLQRRSEVTGSISSSFQKAETWYVCVVLRKRSLRRGGHFRLNFLFRFLIKHSWHFQTFQSVSLLFLWSHLTAGKSALTQHVSSCSWVWCSCAVEALGRMLKCLVTFKENSVAEKALMWRFRTFLWSHPESADWSRWRVQVTEVFFSEWCHIGWYVLLILMFGNPFQSKCFKCES